MPHGHWNIPTFIPYLEDHPKTRKWLVTPIYKPFRPVGRGTTLLRGLINYGIYGY